MANKMLIDATHSEETRVVVVKGDRVEEFDFESANRKQLRGNIYLAKVTRVEPSLQAAFVDYGGNRHGFLAFSEIHPDYYQIPVADREALAQQEAEDERTDAAAENAALDQESEEKQAPKKRGRRRKSSTKSAEQSKDDAVASDEVAADTTDDGGNGPVDVDVAADISDDEKNGADVKAGSESGNDESVSKDVTDDDSDTVEVTENDVLDGVTDDEEEESVDSIGAEDALEEVPVRPRKRARRYKIQEVIKRNQVLLIQVVKEERGNKGAALTTYMSIAGRYCVLMPNTARGGGISRKITSTADRKRLRTIAGELDLPEGMGVILRTAGASRTKAEIKRDYEYLLRLWETVRDITLESVAPTLVYEEGSLVKRSIRDLYSKEIDEILVGGEAAYKEAKAFMRMLMPTHAKNVKQYTDTQPIFARFNIENQLSAMFSPQVRLKSGGYIVINQTEALVAIDVNSGKSTREHNIEATAVATNLEAAAEVARQFRLRDLAGLIVIDFIDMEEKRNNRAVERKLKECLKSDRARIQVGRISHFGLLEMSRQRLRSGVLEGSTDACRHCEGTGVIRSTESVALHILRMIEEALMKGRPCDLKVSTNPAAALYILNSKRTHLHDIEVQFGVNVSIESDPALVGIDSVIERVGNERGSVRQPERAASNDDDRSESKSRRRGRRGGRNQSSANEDAADVAAAAEQTAADGADGDEKGEKDEERKRGGRRRGRRGGRGRRPAADRAAQADQDSQDNAAQEQSNATAAKDGGSETEQVVTTDDSTNDQNTDNAGSEASENSDNKPKKRTPRRRAPRRKKADDNKGNEVAASADTASSEETATEDVTEEKPKKAPARRRTRKTATKEDKKENGSGDSPAKDSSKSNEVTPSNPAPDLAANASVDDSASDKQDPPRRGWWRRAMS